MNFFGGAFVIPNPNTVLSDGVVVASGNVPEYKNSSGLLLGDSGSKMSDKISKDGSISMTGPLDMNGQNVNNTAHLVPDVTYTRDVGTSLKRYRGVFVSELIGPTYSTDTDDLVSTGAVNVDDNFASYNGTNSRLLQDSGVNTTTFLHVDGSNGMQADLDMNNNDLVFVKDLAMAGDLAGTTHVRSADDILSSTGSSVNLTVPVYSGTDSKVVSSSGVLLTDKLNVSGTLPMTGNLNMNSHEILNATRYGTPDTNFTAGNTAVSGTQYNVTIGDGASTTGAVQEAVAIGRLASVTSNGGTAVGREAVAGFLDTAVGSLATSVGGLGGVVLGFDSHSTAQAAHIIGTGVTNSVARSLLLSGFGGSGVLVNVRSFDPDSTDLGTTTNQFKTVYCNNVDRNAAVLLLGNSTATGVTIAQATIPTIISGKGYVATTRPIMSGGYVQTTNVTVVNTTTETPFIGAGVGSLTAAANSQSVGNVSKMHASGTVGITGATQTVTLRLYGGPTSTTLLATNVISLQSITASAAWTLETASTMKSLGVGGTVQLNSVFTVNDLTPSQAYDNQTLATINTTVANVFLFTVQWTNANAANTITSSQFFTHSVYVV